jgi:hypothetical protein
LRGWRIEKRRQELLGAAKPIGLLVLELLGVGIVVVVVVGVGFVVDWQRGKMGALVKRHYERRLLQETVAADF